MCHVYIVNAPHSERILPEYPSLSYAIHCRKFMYIAAVHIGHCTAVSPLLQSEPGCSYIVIIVFSRHYRVCEFGNIPPPSRIYLSSRRCRCKYAFQRHSVSVPIPQHRQRHWWGVESAISEHLACRNAHKHAIRHMV